MVDPVTLPFLTSEQLGDGKTLLGQRAGAEAPPGYLEEVDRLSYQVRVIMIKGQLNIIPDAEVDARSVEIINAAASRLGKEPNDLAEHIYGAFNHHPEEKVHALDVAGRPRYLH